MGENFLENHPHAEKGCMRPYTDEFNRRFVSMKNVQREKRSIKEKQVSKKETVLGGEKKGKKRLTFIAILICAGLLVFAGFSILRIGEMRDAVAVGNQVTHPVNLFEDGRARHFQLDTKGGKSIKYFVLKSSDGVIRAAFDACDVCWASGKGYYQAEDYMVCRNCGKRFASVKVNEVKGGCNPAPLARKVVGGKLVIQVEDILEGRQYFDFSREG